MKGRKKEEKGWVMLSKAPTAMVIDKEHIPGGQGRRKIDTKRLIQSKTERNILTSFEEMYIGLEGTADLVLAGRHRDVAAIEGGVT